MRGGRIVLWAVIMLTALLFLWLVRSVVFPFVVAITMAALLEPLVRKTHQRGLSRKSSVYLVVFGFLTIMVGATILAAPSVVHQAASLTNRVQDFTRTLTQVDESENFFVRWNPVVRAKNEGAAATQIDNLLSHYGSTLDRFGLPSTRRGFVDRYIDKNRPQIAKYVQGFFNSLFGVLTNAASQLIFVFIVPLVATMILLDMDQFRRQTPKWIPPAFRQTALQLLSEVGDVFFSYLRGMGTVVLLFIAAQTVLMLLMGVPYAILLGVLFGALYLIPYIGNVLAAITLFCVLAFSGIDGNFLFHLGSPWSYAVLVTVIYVAIGFVFDHGIYPQMVGNSVGLGPVVSIFVVFCGEALFGLPGMLIAYPLAGSIKVILDRMIKYTMVAKEEVRLPVTPLRHQ